MQEITAIVMDLIEEESIEIHEFNIEDTGETYLITLDIVKKEGNKNV